MAQAREFTQEVRTELTKVSWPTRPELAYATMSVIVMVLLVSVFVGLVDRVLTFLLGLLFQ
jgi:preprotein translocase subunit SecE